MPDAYRRPTFAAAVVYKRPFEALDRLERLSASSAQSLSPTRAVAWAMPMKFGDGYIMVGREWADFVASPVSLSGRNTQTLHVHLDDGLDAHCERARAAGAEIVREPEDQFYGERVYIAKDPEGHVWSFAQNLRMSRARKRKRPAD